MTAEGIKLDTVLIDTLLSAYMRQAEDTLRVYAADAAINGLHYPRHDEETAVCTFVRSIQLAGQAFLEGPLWTPLTANWNRVQSALPNFFDKLNDAGQHEEDSGEINPHQERDSSAESAVNYVEVRKMLHVNEKERLADGPHNPRPDFIRRLRAGLGHTGSICGVQREFQKTSLREICTASTQLSEWFAAIEPRFIDLLTPFRGFKA